MREPSIELLLRVFSKKVWGVSYTLPWTVGVVCIRQRPAVCSPLKSGGPKSIKTGDRNPAQTTGGQAGSRAFSPALSSGNETMPEGLSMYAEKVYNAMKQAGIDSEEKMVNADRIVGLAKAPKNFVLRALDELQSKGHVKRKAREKAAGYYLIPK
ncbi:MAG: hypothetical protein JW880_05805 [Candidatus Thermoplasmatota archaeon]|nr:hypothetical protein [Candidatus Thermoplasmatota archaeon]